MESSGPARSGPTRCSTTHAPLTGSILRTPGRTMRPETSCGRLGRAACRNSRTANLHIELPKVFWPHVLQVFLQLLGRHLIGRFGERLRSRLAFLEEQRGEQALLRVYRRLESQRDRYAVRRPGVDVHWPRAASDVELRVERAILDFGDVDASKRSTQTYDEILAEVVGERPLALQLVHLDHDRLGLWLADPDRKQSRPALLLENHHIGVGRAVQTEPHHFDFDELHQFKLTTVHSLPQIRYPVES